MVNPIVAPPGRATAGCSASSSSADKSGTHCRSWSPVISLVASHMAGASSGVLGSRSPVASGSSPLTSHFIPATSTFWPRFSYVVLLVLGSASSAVLSVDTSPNVAPGSPADVAGHWTLPSTTFVRTAGRMVSSRGPPVKVKKSEWRDRWMDMTI